MVQKKRLSTISLPGLTELSPLSLDAPSLIHDYRRYFTYSLGQNKYCHSVNYFYKALALTVRDRLMGSCRRRSIAGAGTRTGRRPATPTLNLNANGGITCRWSS